MFTLFFEMNRIIWKILHYSTYVAILIFDWMLSPPTVGLISSGGGHPYVVWSIIIHSATIITILFITCMLIVIGRIFGLKIFLKKLACVYYWLIFKYFLLYFDSTIKVSYLKRTCAAFTTFLHPLTRATATTVVTSFLHIIRVWISEHLPLCTSCTLTAFSIPRERTSC